MVPTPIVPWYTTRRTHMISIVTTSSHQKRHCFSGGGASCENNSAPATCTNLNNEDVLSIQACTRTPLRTRERCTTCLPHGIWPANAGLSAQAAAIGESAGVRLSFDTRRRRRRTAVGGRTFIDQMRPNAMKKSCSLNGDSQRGSKRRQLDY